MADSRAEEGRHKMSLEHLVPEIKEVLKDRSYVTDKDKEQSFPKALP